MRSKCYFDISLTLFFLTFIIRPFALTFAFRVSLSISLNNILEHCGIYFSVLYSSLFFFCSVQNCGLNRILNGKFYYAHIFTFIIFIRSFARSLHSNTFKLTHSTLKFDPLFGFFSINCFLMQLESALRSTIT